MNRRNVLSYAGWGIGGFALSLNDNVQLSISGFVLLSIIVALCLTFIILIYRITNKCDLVALVKAWRSGSLSNSPSLSSGGKENSFRELIEDGQPPPTETQ